MRVAGNKLKHIVDFFYTELEGMYASTEIEAIVTTAIAAVLGFSRTEVLQKKEENINQSDLLKLYDCAKDLKKNIPLQYVLGETWFYDLKFIVNKHVLIPRPETEELVDIILKENKHLHSLLDIGTGSGCIPVSIKKHAPSAKISACDISKDALAIAKKNAERNSTELFFFEADVLTPGNIEKKSAGPFEVIVSNPPYIKADEKNEIEKHVLEHEPHLALFVDNPDPILFYKKIIDLCPALLAKQGKLYFELNPLTAKDVKHYADKQGTFQNTELMKDMSGALRFFKGIKK